MEAKRTATEKDLVKSIVRSEILANFVGAPVAGCYGALMIDFRALSFSSFALFIAVALAANQILLALPMNGALLWRVRRGFESWRSGEGGQEGVYSFYRFMIRLPLIQAGFVLLRMAIACGVVLVACRDGLPLPEAAASAITFGLYASVLTCACIYYGMYGSSSSVAESLVAALPRGHALFSEERRNKGLLSLSSIPAIVPTVILTIAIVFMLRVMKNYPEEADAYNVKIAVTLGMNVAFSAGLLALGQWFRRRRLLKIIEALRDMTERGDTSGRIPTDMADSYALTAHQINRALDLFRMVLDQLESASGRLAGSVLSFSSQIKQTVATTSEQAASVRQIVGSMEDSTVVNRGMGQKASELARDSEESLGMVDTGFGLVQDNIRKMDDIKGANARTLGQISELKEQVYSIGEIIDLINGIANQTRIIAFNAELEASAAGQAGLSFRIVAEEIRRLANNTVEALVAIRSRIMDIRKASEELSQASEEGTTRIEEGMKISADLNDIFVSIRMSADRTTSSATGISQNLESQAASYDRTFSGLKAIAEGAEQVIATTRSSGGEVEKLQRLVEDLKDIRQKLVNKAD